MLVSLSLHVTITIRIGISIRIFNGISIGIHIKLPFHLLQGFLACLVDKRKDLLRTCEEALKLITISLILKLI